MNHGIFVAPFGPLADPHRMVQVAAAVEEAGWDGLFLWDHSHRHRADPARSAGHPHCPSTAWHSNLDRLNDPAHPFGSRLGAKH